MDKDQFKKFAAVTNINQMTFVLRVDGGPHTAYAPQVISSTERAELYKSFSILLELPEINQVPARSEQPTVGCDVNFSVFWLNNAAITALANAGVEKLAAYAEKETAVSRLAK